MKYITVTVPKTPKDRWTVSLFGKTPHKRKDATSLYRLVERKLSASLGSCMKEKTACRVKYGDGVNVSLGSSDKNYLLYTLSCFLEDYLTKTVLNRAERQYL
jgi:hypothetical protein